MDQASNGSRVSLEVVARQWCLCVGVQGTQMGLASVLFVVYLFEQGVVHCDSGLNSSLPGPGPLQSQACSFCSHETFYGKSCILFWSHFKLGFECQDLQMVSPWIPHPDRKQDWVRGMGPGK